MTSATARRLHTQNTPERLFHKLHADGEHAHLWALPYAKDANGQPVPTYGVNCLPGCADEGIVPWLDPWWPVDHTGLLVVLREYAEALKEGRHLARSRECIASALDGFADTLGNLHDEGGRDSLTLREHRKELGLCEDGGEHFAERCHLFECETWWEHRQDERLDAIGGGW